MPSGKTHQRINEAAAGVITPATFALIWRMTGDPSRAITVTAYGLAGMLFATFFADPDLDQDHITLTESRLRKMPLVGLPLYLLFVAFWYPYAKMARHRGMSHRPIVGTLLRMGYILLVFTLLNGLGRWVLLGTPKDWTAPLLALASWMVANPVEAGAWVGGVCFIDLLHTLADWLWPHPVHNVPRVAWRRLDYMTARRQWDRS